MEWRKQLQKLRNLTKMSKSGNGVATRNTVEQDLEKVIKRHQNLNLQIWLNKGNPKKKEKTIFYDSVAHETLINPKNSICWFPVKDDS